MMSGIVKFVEVVAEIVAIVAGTASAFQVTEVGGLELCGSALVSAIVR